MIKIYGQPGCPDCRSLLLDIYGRSEFQFTDIGSGPRVLKEFLKLREENPAFSACREAGKLGIPCFVFENGAVEVCGDGFDPETGESPAEQAVREAKKKKRDPLLIPRLEALIQDTDNVITDLSNAAALLYEELPLLNWAGFYLMEKGRLVLGPFQGKTACTLIPVGKGVCGSAVKENRTLLVPDVHAFPGHIACDSASNSEIVVPIRKGKEVIGVLDIDSPVLSRFSEEDREMLEEFVYILEKKF